MTHRRSPVRLLLWWCAVALGIVLSFPGGTARAADKTLEFPRLETTATLLPNGDLEVTEHVTYRFRGGPFTIGVREFDDAWRSQVRGFSASLDGAALDVDLPSATPTGEYEWHFPEPVSDTTVTYTLRYRVLGAAEVGSDVAELYWDFTGENHPPIGAVHIEVQLPGDHPNAAPETPADDASVVRAWAHGPRNGTVSLGASVVTADVDHVPDGQFVELRVLVPAASMDATGDSPRLADVLAEEGEFIDGFSVPPSEPTPWYESAALICTPVVAAGGLAALGVIWHKWGREPTPREVLGEYWREPLEDPPAVVSATMGKGGINRSNAIAGTLMDMAQRGYLRISSDERGKEHTFHWVGKAYGPDVRPFERDLLKLVFRGRTEMSADELTRWARKHRSKASKQMNAWATAVGKEYKARHYSTTPTGTPARAVAAVCGVMLAAGALVMIARGLIGVVIFGAAAVVLVVGMFALTNRTQAGAEAHARAKGLKKYLEDFSQLDEAPVGHLILWERFLVYAVALGVADDLVRNLAFRVPEVANDPAFAAWYIGAGAHRFDGMGRMGNVGSSIASSFSPPSKSGSGGGFSGGGGGGGGGGGFGAR